MALPVASFFLKPDAEGTLQIKIHALTNQGGLPIRFELTPGQVYDAPPRQTLLDAYNPANM